MKKVILILLVIAFAVFAEDKKGGHKHHEHHKSGEKRNSDKKVAFLVQDVKKKTVEITIVAAYNAENYGMNFNGHAKGKAAYKIPTDWKVTVKFENWSPVPHSVVIVEEDMISGPQVGAAYFDGATTPNATLATAPKKASFTFSPDEAGDFAFACGFPAHSANGQWIKLEVSDDFKKAEYVFPKKK